MIEKVGAYQVVVKERDNIINVFLNTDVPSFDLKFPINECEYLYEIKYQHSFSTPYGRKIGIIKKSEKKFVMPHLLDLSLSFLFYLIPVFIEYEVKVVEIKDNEFAGIEKEEIIRSVLNTLGIELSLIRR